MRAVSPNTGAPEVVVAEQQEEYMPLSVACYAHPDGTRSLVTAWVPSREERAALAERIAYHQRTELPLEAVLERAFRDVPIYVKQLTIGPYMTPLMVTVGPEPWMRVEEAPRG